MAMIRIVMESNDVRDMLDELKITGEEIYTSRSSTILIMEMAEQEFRFKLKIYPKQVAC